ncbi:MAG TPA: long-chain fatty acid--CoA ligase [bacterium]|jgi:long-chain acyl-CoA synthetase|nr:long-chain fatty acid--CoA ligase [bacterium]HOG37936.1 long-chain fatty acid--CoA ligase [bacterium]HQI02994.1 long-chain fatty acid--CoA ligase [bacterium]
MVQLKYKSPKLMDQNTIYLNFKKNVITYPSNTALAYIENGNYRKISYKSLNENILKLVSYFVENKLQKGDKVVIFSENRWEWPTVDLACNYLGLILVPIHTTYGTKYIDYIISQTKPKIIFISNDKLLNVFYGIDEHLIDDLQIISFDKVEKENVKYFDDILKVENNKKIEPINDKNLVTTIIYTSGTTDMPKGAVLTNYNILSNIENVLKYTPTCSNDIFFSFLPLSHVLERVAGQFLPLVSGVSIYYSRSPKTLIDDIKLAKPTVIISVPRIFEKIFDKIHDNLRSDSKFKNNLFYFAIKNQSKLNSLKRHNKKINFFLLILCGILDKIVFRKIRNIFGGNLRLAISGGSSLDKRIARFFEDVGIKIIEGYGVTETSPIISVNKTNEYKLGTVGFVLENLEVKINNDKEILVRGSSVMKEYYNDKESTEKVIDTDGWFYTGDLGFLDKDGFLNIIGRKKEVIVLSTGKNVVPGNIELVLNYDKYINQSIVIGNNEKFLIALIVPDFEEIEKYCSLNNIAVDNEKSYLNLDKIQIFYRDRINNLLKGFSRYEQIVHFYLVSRQFDEKHDELTPTLKIKRETIIEHFNKIIRSFYN